MTENLWYEILNITKEQESNPDKGVIELYYKGEFVPWHDIVPYNVYVAVVVSMLKKIAKYGWLVADALIIIFCRALSLKFKSLNELIQKELIDVERKRSEKAKSQFFSKSMDYAQSEMIINSIKMQSFMGTGSEREIDGNTKWEEVYKQFEMLVDLTDDVERYAAPLFMALYVCMGQILTIVFSWIAPDIKVPLPNFDSIYLNFGAFYYIFRLGFVTYFVTEVYHAGYNILVTLEHCPCSTFSLAVNFYQV